MIRDGGGEGPDCSVNNVPLVARCSEKKLSLSPTDSVSPEPLAGYVNHEVESSFFLLFCLRDVAFFCLGHGNDSILTYSLPAET